MASDEWWVATKGACRCRVAGSTNPRISTPPLLCEHLAGIMIEESFPGRKSGSQCSVRILGIRVVIHAREHLTAERVTSQPHASESHVEGEASCDAGLLLEPGCFLEVLTGACGVIGQPASDKLDHTAASGQSESAISTLFA